METLYRQIFCDLVLKGVKMWPSLEVDKKSRECLLCFDLLKIKDIQARLYDLSDIESIFIICETSFCPSFKFLFLHCSLQPTS